jgi:predicted RecA/RadA family phage recombinase
MTNYIQDGDTITVAAPATVLSGAGVLLGSIFGVASGDATSGASVEIMVEGVFDLAKDTSTFATYGLLVYWDDSAKKVTTTVGSNKMIGVTAGTAATGDATVRVRLNGAFIA